MKLLTQHVVSLHLYLDASFARPPHPPPPPPPSPSSSHMILLDLPSHPMSSSSPLLMLKLPFHPTHLLDHPPIPNPPIFVLEMLREGHTLHLDSPILPPLKNIFVSCMVSDA